MTARMPDPGRVTVSLRKSIVCIEESLEWQKRRGNDYSSKVILNNASEEIIDAVIAHAARIGQLTALG